MVASCFPVRYQRFTVAIRTALRPAVIHWVVSVRAGTVAGMAGIEYIRGDATAPHAKGAKVIAHVCNDPIDVVDHGDRHRREARLFHRRIHVHDLS
jgi:hypothetical protein